MKYQEFLARDHFEKDELLAHSAGTLVEDAPADMTARLPAPPFLMVDRIVDFVKGQDTIAIDDFLVLDFNTLDTFTDGVLDGNDANVTIAGGDTFIDIGANSIQVDNQTALDAGDFTFF